MTLIDYEIYQMFEGAPSEQKKYIGSGEDVNLDMLTLPAMKLVEENDETLFN